MSENQVRAEKTGTGEENQVRVEKSANAGNDGKHETKLKTRCYYTDYVNHAIRFFLTTPETLKLEGKRRADLDNWIAVQAVFHCLKDEDRQILETIYRSNYRVAAGVRDYCKRTGADERKTWMLITRTSAAIAKRRGLV